MAVSLRRHRRTLDIWPGFVDALATLLIVIMFLLLVFVLAQFYLSQALSGRDAALVRLQGQVDELADLLSLSRSKNEALEGDISRLSSQLQATLAERYELSVAVSALTQRAEGAEKRSAALEQSSAADQKALAKLSGDIAALEALKEELQREAAALAGKVDEKDQALIAEKELSESARAQVALLNKQLQSLRDQIQQLSTALDIAEEKTKAQEVQITNLGQRLNAALASKVQELQRYRSEFFGRLRELLGDQAGVRVVGDRFVFQSEVLFESGSATLGEQGREQILQVAKTLKEVASRIPDDIDWILQVEGHTDRRPINTSEFPSNWELSTARATSVLRLLREAGIPAERLSAAGFGEFHPIDDRDDPAALQRNRRIELKLTQR
jgi:chemotaxis protein MotB